MLQWDLAARMKGCFMENAEQTHVKCVWAGKEEKEAESAL